MWPPGWPRPRRSVASHSTLPNSSLAPSAPRPGPGSLAALRSVSSPPRRVPRRLCWVTMPMTRPRRSCSGSCEEAGRPALPEWPHAGVPGFARCSTCHVRHWRTTSPSAESSPGTIRPMLTPGTSGRGFGPRSSRDWSIVFQTWLPSWREPGSRPRRPGSRGMPSQRSFQHWNRWSQHVAFPLQHPRCAAIVQSFGMPFWPPWAAGSGFRWASEDWRHWTGCCWGAAVPAWYDSPVGSRRNSPRGG